MARTGLKGRGTESADLTAGAVFAGLTALIDGFLLSRIWRWAGQQTPDEHHAAVVQTMMLLGFVGFTALLGVAIAGNHSTPHRRWRCAAFGGLLCHLLVPLVLVIAFLIAPPTITIPW
ncbi:MULTISPECIES: hypothetical protein [Streptomyces]|uniref:hypothetical protein n=1 Tax=Streptomyces TaxID=1883 RepID=UPI0004AA00C5|nr:MULTISPECIES: hypothetical protein [Streptomyces]